ncbi:hypothetical protein ABW20_dc0100321 [Dactylellina cionopaga]|nr:hypothetical protein ABW20_dc0100321 [Dactylellina cionopaga]
MSTDDQALSRTPTPTLPNLTPADNPFDAETPTATNTDVSENEEDDDDDGDDDTGGDYDQTDYFLNNALFSQLITALTTITNSSIDASIGTSTLSLRKYYSSKLTELSNDPAYDVPLTDPPCPYIILKAVDQVRYSDNCQISCPCCLPEDLPQLKIIAEEVEGGVVTHKVVVEGLKGWLYGEHTVDGNVVATGPSEQAVELAKVVDGIEAGESGVADWNCMSGARKDGNSSIMGRELFLYFAKPLVGGGKHNSHRDDDHGGCGRE